MTTRQSKKEVPWGKSEIKDLLKNDVLSGKIPDSMSVKKAHESRSEYKEMELTLFWSCLYSIKRQLKTSKQRAHDNDQHLAHDRRIYPKTTHNSNGLPIWDESAAQRLLKIDIAAGLYIPGNVQPLWASQSEYKIFSLDVFRSHIHQEICKGKFVVQYATCYA